VRLEALDLPRYRAKGILRFPQPPPGALAEWQNLAVFRRSQADVSRVLSPGACPKKSRKSGEFDEV